MKPLEGWPYQPELCPVDDDFIELMASQEVMGKSLLHVGTGMHHKVGKVAFARRMDYWGVTASEEEFEARPFYCQTILGDIYKINLGYTSWDYLTLFHLGELVDRYGDIDTLAIDNLIKGVKRDGLVFFYLGSPDSKFKSSAADRVMPYVEYNKLLKSVGYFKSIQFYAKT